MKIWHISDTHELHRQIQVQEADVVIHTGDAANSRDPHKNAEAFMDFLDWFGKLPHKIKLFSPGNHDSCIEHNKVTFAKEFTPRGILAILDSHLTIENIKFYATPYSPSFNNWCFGKDRTKMHAVWEKVPADTDVLITHGPPYGILDISENRDGVLERCGDKSLAKHLLYAGWNVKYCLFGHIHDREWHSNSGILLRDGITYSNASVVEDRHMDRVIRHGNLIQITKNGE